MPVRRGSTSSEPNELIDRLLEVGRPLEAFNAVDLSWKRVDTSRLRQLLSVLATVEPSGPIDHYSLSLALDALDERPEATIAEKAGLEFAYITILTGSEHGIPNLERLASTTPSVFVELIEALYGEKPDGEDQGPRASRRQAQAMAAFSTLEILSRTPGSEESGKIDSEKLSSWIADVRASCSDLDILGGCDSEIGQLLSRATADNDGHWPCRTSL